VSWKKSCKRNWARKTQEKLQKSRRKDKNTSANGVKRARFDGQIA
jgi:hypothetical protein